MDGVVGVVCMDGVVSMVCVIRGKIFEEHARDFFRFDINELGSTWAAL